MPHDLGREVVAEKARQQLLSGRHLPDSGGGRAFLTARSVEGSTQPGAHGMLPAPHKELTLRLLPDGMVHSGV